MMKGIQSISRIEGYPNADEVMKRGVLLPLHHGMTDSMFDRFFSCVEDFLKLYA